MAIVQREMREISIGDQDVPLYQCSDRIDSESHRCIAKKTTHVDTLREPQTIFMQWRFVQVWCVRSLPLTLRTTEVEKASISLSHQNLLACWLADPLYLD